MSKLKPKSPIKPSRNKFNSSSLLSDKFNESYIRFPYDIRDGGIDSNVEFHVDHLKKQFSDLARPNLFKVRINPPVALYEDWGNQPDLMVLVKSTKIPSMTIKEFVFQRAGQRLNIPTGEVEHGDFSITFYNDSNLDIRTNFNRWMRLCAMNWESNRGALPLLVLQGDIVVYQFDYKLSPVYAVKMTNCWPSSVSEIELSQENENSVSEFTVDFKYTSQEIFKSFEV